MKQFKVQLTLVGMALLLPLAAQANVGKVIFANGPVNVERDSIVSLKKGDAIEEGDIVITGAKARAQLLMMDGARISLRADSRLEIETYQLDAPRASAIATPSAEGSVSLSLLKGGLRTITGAIGKADPEDYAMRTPVATLGIRGTDFRVRHCSGDCQPRGRSSDAKAPADGTYAAINSGGVTVGNATGTLDLDPGDFGYVKDASTPPQQLVTPPPVFVADSADTDEEDTEEDE